MQVYFNSVENNKPEFYSTLTDYLANHASNVFDENKIQKYLANYNYNFDKLLTNLMKYLPIISTKEILENEYIGNTEHNKEVVLNQFIDNNQIMFYNVYDFEYDNDVRPLTNEKLLKQILARV